MLCSFLLIISCKKEKLASDYHEGNIELVADESFRSVCEALADGYMMHYPKAKITVKTQKEDLAFVDLLNGKAQLIVMSRDISAKEKQQYKERVNSDIIPANFAADAVVFIVAKNAARENISMEKIKTLLKSPDSPFIFDAVNSSNLNFVAQKIQEAPKNLHFKIIDGNENVAGQIGKFPDKIGVISLNTFSREYAAHAQQLRQNCKILGVIQNNKTYTPEIHNLQSMEYPFTRVAYFITRQGNFNIANAFIRFSCTQIGQKIVQKEGLQPYNLYKREVQLH